MGYVGSYVWKIRQKVGNARIITATVDVLPVNPEGKIKFVYAEHLHCWSIVGGHVEEGDSWASAALHELEEEAGIVARKEDLELFATISGPGRVYKYADGETQPFTNIFLCKNWESEGTPTDTEEVQKTKWMTVEEARVHGTNPHVEVILDAYERYLQIGLVQMIEE